MGAKKRLGLIRERTKSLKESNYAVGAEFLMNIGTWAPPTIHAMAARAASRTRVINLVVSNVPGPRVPMYIAGARLLAQYPVMPLAENMGLSVAVTSLAGTMAFGITADWDTLPDIGVLAEGMDEAILELRKAAEQEAAGEASKPKRRVVKRVRGGRPVVKRPARPRPDGGG